MRVLYIGVYRDGTGWSRAANDYILALEASGVDVVPRPLRLSPNHSVPPARVLELESLSSSDCDVVIQHALPHHMEYSGHFQKNIGLCATETDSFRWSHWPERLNLMDEAWGICESQKAAFEKSGVTKPIRIVPHACDITRYQRRYQPLRELKDRLAGNFAFYTVGELNRRKNLPALIKAFHLEFHPNEPVSLVLKVNKQGLPPQEIAKHLEAMCDDIKASLKLFRNVNSYHREIVIPDFCSDEELLRLHSTCDCFVQTSFGECWSYPAFDAMGLGKTPIVTAVGGYLDYLSNDSGWLVPGREEPVFGERETFADIFTGYENWVGVDVNELRRAMRQAYEDSELRRQKAAAGINRAFEFSYENVGALMRDLIYAPPPTS